MLRQTQFKSVVKQNSLGLEVNPLFLDYEWTALHHGVDRPDIFADNSDSYQLNRAEEKQTYDNRRYAYLEVVPEDQFRYQVAGADRHAQQCKYETDKCNEPQRNLGQVCNAQHREVI